MLALSNAVFRIDGELGYHLALDVQLNDNPPHNVNFLGYEKYDYTLDRRFPMSMQDGPYVVPWDGRIYVNIKPTTAAVLPGNESSATAISGDVRVFQQ